MGRVQPVTRLRYDVLPAVDRARDAAAGVLGVGHDSLALVPNVTHAVAAVLSSMAWTSRLGAGDVVVVSNHGYEHVQNAVSVWCARTGATVHTARYAVDATAEEVVAAHRAALEEIAASGRTARLVVVDAVTSPTAMVQPVGAVADLAHDHGAFVFVDAAHVPGQCPDLGPDRTRGDWWTGAWHTWGYAPRGTSVLWAAADARLWLEPVTTSWSHGDGFPATFRVHGTDDYAGWLALPDAITFWEDAGGHDLGRRASLLLDEVTPLVEQAVASCGLPRSSTVVPRDPAPCLRLVALPDGFATTPHLVDDLVRGLGAEGLDVGCPRFGGRGYLRLSAAAYNTAGDYGRLADVIPLVLRALASGTR